MTQARLQSPAVTASQMCLEPIVHGIRANIAQICLQLLQIFLVGLTIGMSRVVIPGLAESQFGLGQQSFFLLTSFVVVFGIVKALMNLIAGRLSERYGRKKILLLGWYLAMPIPLLLLYAPSWNWIILTTVLLGFNQGLCWSMALNSKLDLSKNTQKGLVNGLNEFAGYVAVGLAGLITAYMTSVYGAPQALFYFSFSVILLGLILAKFTIVETLPWALQHQLDSTAPQTQQVKNFWELIKASSLESRPLFALNQAGLVEKFTDGIVWIFLPVFFLSKGISLIQSGAIIAIYGVVWGVSQLFTGPLSDRIGRKGLIVWGMWICAIGVLLIPMTQNIVLWSLEAALIGIGMAMLYPNLGAAVGDFSPPQHRASIIGIYRFWRDLGYAIGALIMGIMAQWSQNLLLPFYFVAAAMVCSGLIVQCWLPATKPQ
ncbi:MAG: MFS transporter [SAR86 cluster bacterium]|uniref:MFS transporter n=1 Tax=SAR86 cluster bacterium TaxID=2030880 RepID=A0A2A4MPN8_9GAMM|nr:MAG: MFS transporter [SAR86 cluster bacterium]